MPLNFTAAHSSRVMKRPRARPISLQRATTAPFPPLTKRKPPPRSQSFDEDNKQGDLDNAIDALDDHGLVRTLATERPLRNVVEAIFYGQSHMFDDVPESGGFNSVRIQEILNYRRRLPPLVTKTHVHALLESPTATERELSKRQRDRSVQKLTVTARGVGSSNVGEVLVLTRDIAKLLEAVSEVSPQLRAKFLQDLENSSTVGRLSPNAYTVDDLRSFMRAGFLIAKSAVQSPSFAAPLSAALQGTATSIANVSRAASGSVAAVGGQDAVSMAGGRGGHRVDSTSISGDRRLAITDLQLWVPGIGPYLKLVVATRSHLLTLIEKSRSQQIPLYLLKEQWNGAISRDDPASRAKKFRGEFAGVLPARTKKWRHFHGISFEWVLAECLGAGLIELFETGSVGQAARLV